MKSVDYYSLLGVDVSASSFDIKQAYKRLALLNHPHRSPTEADVLAFEKVAEAYSVLSDEEKRKDYDVNRHSVKSTDVDPFQVFGSVFEELLASEVSAVSTFWSYVGGISGLCLGFIVANVPGLIAGAYAGSTLGKIRDRSGVSVYDAFQRLGKKQKMEVLNRIAKSLL